VTGCIILARWQEKAGIEVRSRAALYSVMFHDVGLTPRYSSKSERFELDGANSARAFLRQHNIAQRDIDTEWTVIALHMVGASIEDECFTDRLTSPTKIRLLTNLCESYDQLLPLVTVRFRRSKEPRPKGADTLI
jgi:hypothetical protein